MLNLATTNNKKRYMCRDTRKCHCLQVFYFVAIYHGHNFLLLLLTQYSPFGKIYIYLHKPHVFLSIRRSLRPAVGQSETANEWFQCYVVVTFTSVFSCELLHFACDMRLQGPHFFFLWNGRWTACYVHRHSNGFISGFRKHFVDRNLYASLTFISPWHFSSSIFSTYIPFSDLIVRTIMTLRINFNSCLSPTRLPIASRKVSDSNACNLLVGWLRRLHKCFRRLTLETFCKMFLSNSSSLWGFRSITDGFSYTACSHWHILLCRQKFRPEIYWWHVDQSLISSGCFDFRFDKYPSLFTADGVLAVMIISVLYQYFPSRRVWSMNVA